MFGDFRGLEEEEKERKTRHFIRCLSTNLCCRWNPQAQNTVIAFVWGFLHRFKLLILYERSAFANGGLTSIHLPDGVEVIDEF
jgi:hypothetical protein